MPILVSQEKKLKLQKYLQFDIRDPFKNLPSDYSQIHLSQ